MNETEDVGRALAFVIGRIEQEATRSGEALSEEQHFLLHNLPRESTLPSMNGGDPESPLPTIPRDLAYERLISLARDAYRHDLGVNPAAGVEWKIAFVVSKLNRHPMAWLLGWAGLKERRPWWDRAALVGTALLLTGTALVLMIFAGLGGTRLRRIGAGTACVATVILIGYASSHLERWQLRRRLEKYRGTPVGSEK